MKNLFLTKTTEGITGGIHIFVKKPYGGGQIGALKSVQGQKGPQTVAQIDGSLKVDELLAKQLKYFFGMDWPVGQPAWAWLPVRLSLWNGAAESFQKVQPAEGDRVVFFVRGAKITAFRKKDGTTGYQLDATAYDFYRVAQANTQSGQPRSAAPAPALTYPQPTYPAAAPTPAPVTQQPYAAPTPVYQQPTATPAPAPAPTQAPMPAPAPAAAPAASTVPSYGSTTPYTAQDFEAISDSDDLPF